MKNVFAYTEVINQSLPAYASLNKNTTDYSLTVRGRGNEGSSKIDLTKEELAKLHNDLTVELRDEDSMRNEPLAYGIVDPDYAKAFTIIRHLAWEEGYAITLHGSFTRDLDLVAIPWSDKVCEPEHLIRRICASVLKLKDHHANPGTKPHGRKVWTLLFPDFGDPRFIDLSIVTFPKVEDSPVTKD